MASRNPAEIPDRECRLVNHWNLSVLHKGRAIFSSRSLGISAIHAAGISAAPAGIGNEILCRTRRADELSVSECESCGLRRLSAREAKEPNRLDSPVCGGAGARWLACGTSRSMNASNSDVPRTAGMRDAIGIRDVIGEPTMPFQ